MEKNNKVIIYIIPIVCFFIGVLVMYGVFYKYPTILSNNITRIEKSLTVSDDGIADAVEVVYDSVVVVTTYKNNEPYASGTGFVYKEDKNYGYILTNNHVIEKSDKVTVLLSNGEVVETTILGSDVSADIAVLKIPKKKIISVAKLGSSNDLRVGDTAFAVGAPLDNAYSWSVTRGIISGKDRMVEVSSTDTIMKVLQTDAAINNGNSGGPLCNSAGEVIGITSMKLVDESVEGMGFAINIEEAIKYATVIEKGEKVEHPFLGVQMYNVSDAYYSRDYYYVFQQYNITSGVLVYSVADNTPAQKAGLKANDVIVKIDTNSITNVAYLKYYMYEHNPGDTITLTIIRDGAQKNIKVVLGTNK